MRLGSASLDQNVERLSTAEIKRNVTASTSKVAHTTESWVEDDFSHNQNEEINDPNAPEGLSEPK